MRRIFKKWCLIMKGGFTGGFFLRRIREGVIIRNLCYVIICGMLTLVIRYH